MWGSLSCLGRGFAFIFFSCLILSCGSKFDIQSTGRMPIGNEEDPSEAEYKEYYLDISIGYYHSCRIRKDGVVECWGLNDKGQIGSAVALKATKPTPIISDLRYKQVSSGRKTYYTCAIREADGKIECWGDNVNGSLGNSTNNNAYNPVLISSSESYTQVSAGGGQTCAIREVDEKIECWGENYYGQVGDGTTIERLEPVLIDSQYSYKQVSTGCEHTCAIRKVDGKIDCWGWNGFSQLGGAQGQRYSPTVIFSNARYLHVTSGDRHTCAIREDNRRVECWGSNNRGQLGIGNNQDLPTPQYVNSKIRFSQISAVYDHVCAIDEDDKLYCWGWNMYGQIGDGTYENKYVPTLINNGAIYSKVSTGGYHTCAIRKDTGDVECWGWNNHGQVGTGDTFSSARPVSNVK